MPLGLNNIVNNRKFSTLASSIIIISKLNNLDSGKAIRHTRINNLSQFRSVSNATPNNLDSIISQASNNLTVKTELSKNKQKQERVHKNEIQKPNFACSTHSSSPFYKISKLTVRLKAIESKIKNWKKKIHLSTDLLNKTSLRYVESQISKNNLFSGAEGAEYFLFNNKQKKVEKERLSRILYNNYLKKLRSSADPKA